MSEAGAAESRTNEYRRIWVVGLLLLGIMTVLLGMETRWTSYYDPKSLVAYLPVLTAHLKSRR